ncbi:MAG TPA: arginase [Flavobacteriia bacterium]|nr:arginase [Flavobacteriia bacterium]
MDFTYLQPINDTVLKEITSFRTNRLGNEVIFHTENNIPEITDEIKIAILTVDEDRNAINNTGSGSNFDKIRKEFYQLYKGTWNTSIMDIGTIRKGNSIEDTNFAVTKTVHSLLKQNIIPIVIGGSQALTYPMYRAYDNLEQMVNLVAIDNKFDLNDIDAPLNSRNFLSKVIMEEPTNLFNYANIGYQTFFNSQEEIDLLDKLFFDSYRLGYINKDVKTVEPILRDADIVSVDLSALRKTEAPANNNTSPNGFYGEEMCAIFRYAGLSDKITSLGIFEYNPILDDRNQTAQLIAQMIWYFIEGINFRSYEYPFKSKKDYIKYIVPIDEEIINFYKSNISDRWWMEIKDNINKKETLIPCSYQDYLEANNQNLPDKWWKTLRKL